MLTEGNWVKRFVRILCSCNFSVNLKLIENHKFFSIKKFLMFILFLRKKERARWWGAERKEDPKSEAGSRLWPVSTEPDTGLKFMNREIMTWAKVRHLTNWVTQVPLKIVSFKNMSPNVDVLLWMGCDLSRRGKWDLYLSGSEYQTLFRKLVLEITFLDIFPPK